ncbi:MAG TPA: glycosyltransferase [Acidimicrobiia bacterium]|nr:glycosyltransferase [Acidimicrobiia bacterium]
MPESDPELDLTVVVPAHDAAATIAEQLDALAEQEWSGSFEVVVVDNRSSDATAGVVAEYAARDPRFRLVSAPERNSIGYARNTGIAAARGRSIAMCDSDDVVGPGWVAAIGDALASHAFVTGPLDVHRLNPPEVVETRGLAIEHGPGSFLDAFPFAHSCNLAFHRALVDTHGGFDESLVNGSDVELSHRFWRNGVELTYVPDAVVAYRYRATTRGLYRQARNYARVKPVLVARFRSEGTALPSPFSWRRWVWLARNVLLVRTAAGRARWVWVLGGCVGEVQGMWRVRRARRRGRGS